MCGRYHECAHTLFSDVCICTAYIYMMYVFVLHINIYIIYRCARYHECARTLSSDVCICIVYTYVYIHMVGIMNVHELYFLMFVFVLYTHM